MVGSDPKSWVGSTLAADRPWIGGSGSGSVSRIGWIGSGLDRLALDRSTSADLSQIFIFFFPFNLGSFDPFKNWLIQT